MPSQALSFGAIADLYDAVRPGYPADAISWALGDRPLRVLDLGAGTGLLTRALVAAGHDVTSVDPDPDMLAVLAARRPDGAALLGSAERIPLPDGSVDAVTVTPDGLLDLVRSRSSYLVSDEAEQARREAAVRDLTTTHPQLGGDRSFDMPYLTCTFRMRPR